MLQPKPSKIYTWSFWGGGPNQTYIQAIDGLGLEDVFYLAHDKPADKAWCKENWDNALAIKKAGKLVLGIDYCRTPPCIADADAKHRALGFVPYVSVKNLNIGWREGEVPKDTPKKARTPKGKKEP